MSLSNSLRNTAAQTVRLLQLSAIPTTEDLRYIMTTAKQTGKSVALPFKRDPESPILVVKFTLPNKWAFERNDGSNIWTKESLDVLMVQNKVKIDCASTTAQSTTGSFQVYQPDASQSFQESAPAQPQPKTGSTSSSSITEMPFINLFAESIATTEAPTQQASSIPQQGFVAMPAREEAETAVPTDEVPADTEGEVFGEDWSGAQTFVSESVNQGIAQQSVGEINLFGAFIPGAEISKPAVPAEPEAELGVVEPEVQHEAQPEVIEEVPAAELAVEKTEEAVAQVSAAKPALAAKPAETPKPVTAKTPEPIKTVEVATPEILEHPEEPPISLDELKQDLEKDSEEAPILPAPVELDPYASEDIMIGLADPETRLTHFRAFTFFLQRELIRYEVAGANLTVVSFDFSSKETSRTLAVSSEALDAISERLHELCSTLHISARMQTGQFVVLLSDSGIGSAIGFAEAMRGRFTDDPRLKKMCEGSGVLSIGIASASDAIKDAGILLAAAIEAKNMSRASSLNYQIFS